MNFNVKNTKVTFKLASTSYLLMYPHLPVNNSKCRTRLAVVFIYLVTLVAVSKAVSPQNHSNLRVPAVKSEGYSLLATVRRSFNRKWHPQQLKRRQQKNAPPSSANNITGINSNTTGSFPPENSSTCCLPEQWNSIGWDTSEMLVFMIFLIWIIFACLLFFICACCHPRMHRGNLERDLEARGFDEALQNYIFMTIVHAQQISEMIREKEKLASLILENTKMVRGMILFMLLHHHISNVPLKNKSNFTVLIVLKIARYRGMSFVGKLRTESNCISGHCKQ